MKRKLATAITLAIFLAACDNPQANMTKSQKQKYEECQRLYKDCEIKVNGSSMMFVPYSFGGKGFYSRSSLTPSQAHTFSSHVNASPTKSVSVSHGFGSTGHSISIGS